jgi:hypothetical protein
LKKVLGSGKNSIAWSLFVGIAGRGPPEQTKKGTTSDILLDWSYDSQDISQSKESGNKKRG